MTPWGEPTKRRVVRLTVVLFRVLGVAGFVWLLVACQEKAMAAPRPANDGGSGVAKAAESAPSERSLLDDSRIDWNANPSMRALGKVAASLEESEYQNGLLVNENQGIYRFDCSGMVQWILRRSAPRAASAMAHGLESRPLARDFERRIERAPTDRSRLGWRRIARVRDAQPGDVIAWLKPVEIQSPNTGHVAFVVLPPVLAPGYDNAYLVRIADSTRLLHDDDTRVGRNGFGLGTILVVADAETDEPIAYGWVALKWRAFATKIALGRPG